MARLAARTSGDSVGEAFDNIVDAISTNMPKTLKKYGLITSVRKKNPYKMMAKKTQEHSIRKNILNREFNPKRPNQVYSTDITYLYYGNSQRAYLSAMKDLASGELIAHEMSQNLTVDFVKKTIDEALKATPKEALSELIIHSDQGFHYTHPEYQKGLAENGIIQSMSRKGNCLDNAPIESFFGHLKDELDYKNCKDYNELVEKVEEYMYYYNNKRYQWSKSKMTPIEYRSHLLSA